MVLAQTIVKIQTLDLRYSSPVIGSLISAVLIIVGIPYLSKQSPLKLIIIDNSTLFTNCISIMSTWNIPVPVANSYGQASTSLSISLSCS